MHAYVVMPQLSGNPVREKGQEPMCEREEIKKERSQEHKELNQKERKKTSPSFRCTEHWTDPVPEGGAGGEADKNRSADV